MDILEFQGEHRWLSNFWPAQVLLDGKIFPSIEHAYQAAKTHPSQREPFRHCTGVQAKRLGRTVKMRADWEQEKVLIMRGLIAQKFSPGSELGEKLKATGNCQIVEGNHWGDVFWGVCRGRGQNWLGRLLMERRAFLQTPTKSSLPSRSTAPATKLASGRRCESRLGAGLCAMPLTPHERT